ncbi:hypothetical protein G3479_08255 [Shewanella baltica]|nr:hypothetical protein [Shewanella baltica]
MVICETTVRPMDGAVEHPRMDLLRVDESMPWRTYQSCNLNSYQQGLASKNSDKPCVFIAILLSCYGWI